MNPRQFDAITRSLAAARSRRSVLRTLGTAALGAVGLAEASRAADAAPGGNSACAHFCAATFGADTAQASQCTSDAAHGRGLCYSCAGPQGSPCGSGLTCTAGGQCVPCVGNRQTCAAATDICCTTGYVCGNAPGGPFFGCCGTPGAACSNDNDCCGNASCAYGKCFCEPGTPGGGC